MYECIASPSDEIHRILLQCQLHPCEVTLEEVEAAPCDFCGSRQVHPSIHLNQIVVCSRVEIEGWFFAMDAVLGIASFILADGDIGVEYIWNRHADSVTLSLLSVSHFTQCFNLFSNTVDFRSNPLKFSIISCLLGCRNPSCCFVALSSKLVSIISGFSPCFIQPDDLIDCIVSKASSVVICPNHISVVTEHPNVQHGLLRFLRNRPSCLKATGNQNRLTSKTKAELPIKMAAEMKYPRMAPPLSNGSPACGLPRATYVISTQ